jgi:uncharacterized protein YidB (DUF937 family)
VSLHDVVIHRDERQVYAVVVRGTLSPMIITGGDMGLFDGVIGGLVGGGLASVVSGLIADHGGISGLVSRFEQGGLGAVAQSWVGTGPNAGVSPDQIHSVLGPDLIQQLSAKTGLSPQVLAQKLSEVLPGVVDHLTPGGVIPRS